MKRVLALAGAFGLLMMLAAPVSAITRGGSLDGDDHPFVGLMVALDEDDHRLWRCSGSLISPTVFVTAGHCTENPVDSAVVFFVSDMEPNPSEYGVPARGGLYTDEGSAGVRGSTHLHPSYNPNGFFLYDLGVVVLEEPVHLDEYAQLPDAGLVDTLPKGRKGTIVTAVGYGLQAASQNPVKPEKTVADLTRYQADLMIVDTEGVAGVGSLPDTNSMVLSGDAKHGGTCFGDSGGPSLVGDDVLIGVTSFGLNGNCAGIGGVFRIDRGLELDWISDFLE